MIVSWKLVVAYIASLCFVGWLLTRGVKIPDALVLAAFQTLLAAAEGVRSARTGKTTVFPTHPPASLAGFADVQIPPSKVPLVVSPPAHDDELDTTMTKGPLDP